MTASPKVVRPIDDQSSLNESSPTSPGDVIDFFEARHRLLTDSERIAQEREIDLQIEEFVTCRERYVGVPDALEDECYWLTSAAVYTFLALGILGL
jgi:hypothetical protein